MDRNDFRVANLLEQIVKLIFVPDIVLRHELRVIPVQLQRGDFTVLILGKIQPIQQILIVTAVDLIIPKASPLVPKHIICPLQLILVGAVINLERRFILQAKGFEQLHIVTEEIVKGRQLPASRFNHVIREIAALHPDSYAVYSQIMLVNCTFCLLANLHRNALIFKHRLQRFSLRRGRRANHIQIVICGLRLVKSQGKVLLVKQVSGKDLGVLILPEAKPLFADDPLLLADDLANPFACNAVLVSDFLKGLSVQTPLKDLPRPFILEFRDILNNRGIEADDQRFPQ